MAQDLNTLYIISPGANPYVLNTQGSGYILGESVPVQVGYPVQYQGQVSISLHTEYSDPDFPVMTPIFSRSYTAGGDIVSEYSTAWKANANASPRSASLHFTPVWQGSGDNPFDADGIDLEIYQEGYSQAVPGITVSPNSITSTAQGGDYYVTASIVNPGSSISITPICSENWILVTLVGEDEPTAQGFKRFFKITTSNYLNTADRNGIVTFALVSDGNTYDYDVQVTQSGLAPYVSVTPSSSTVNVGSSGGNFSMPVTYSPSTATIGTPLRPGWISLSSTSSTTSGNYKIVTYNFGCLPNSGESRGATIQFSATSSGMSASNNIVVVQDAAPAPAIIGSITTDPVSPLTAVSQSTGTIVCVNYVSASAGGYDIKNPNPSTGVNYSIQGTNTRGDITQVTYSLSYPANTSTSPVTHSVNFAMSSSNGVVTSSFKIHQAAADEPVVLPTGSVLAPDSPYTVESGDTSQQVVVIYSESVGRYTIDTPGYGGGVTSVTEVARQFSGNNTVVTWSVNFPANAGTSQVTRWAAFQMTSGSHVPSKQVYIYQEGRGVVVGSVNVGPYNPQNVNAGTTSSTFFVTYSSANSGEYDIKDPITSSGITSIVKSTQSLGSDVYGTYTIKYPANSSTANSVTHSVTFVMSSSNDVKSGVGYVYQAKATPNYSIECTGSVSRDSNAFQARCWVKYNGVLYSDDTELPVWTGNITNVVYRSQTQGDNSVTIAYDITASANLTNSPVYSYITWSIANSAVRATTTITQSAGSTPTPGEAYIEVVGNPLQAESGDWSKTFQVIYHNATNWTIDTPGTGGGTQAVNVVNSSTSGSNKIYTYEASFTANADYEAKTRLVFLQMHSGSEYKYANAQIVQAGKTGTGRITLRPEYARVASFSTESVFQVSASRNGVNYGPLQLTGSSNVVIETIGGGYQDTDDTYYYTYRAKFPLNNSNTPVTRSVTVRMVSESLVAIQTYFVYQDPDTGGGTGTGISISPSSTTITKDGTYASCVAYYYGVSDFSQISTPTTSTSGWVASVGQVQQSSGLTVVTWNFNGTANPNTSQRTINFSIGATGLSSKTFSILQLGSGGGGGSTTTNMKEAWERNIISGSSGATLTVTSGSTTLFSEKVYAQPGDTLARIDLNKICEPYLGFDPVGNSHLVGGADRGEGEDAMIYATWGSPIPTFNASFDSGENYQSRILKDWGYDLEVNDQWHNFCTDFATAERGGENIKAARGQYLVLTYVNTGSSTQPMRFGFVGGTFYTLNCPPYSYANIASRGNPCGLYEFLGPDGEAGRVWDVSSNAKWVVYFRNCHNGLESIVLEGTVVPSVNVTRNTYLGGVYRYTKSYLNGVVNRWKCNTGIMSDYSSYLVSEMISAPEVLLHDIRKNIIYRTRPTANSVEKKTFWNQGRKFATYEFELEHILQQIRR